MKALVKAQAGPGLTIDDIAQPAIGINDVLIRVLRTGICGTDVHIYDWDEWARQTIHVPMAIGHEFVGEIVAVGTPEDVAANRLSRTAPFLREVLKISPSKSLAH